MIWAKNKIPYVMRRGRCHCKTKFVSCLQPPPQKLESWNFGSRSLLGQLDALHTQNFEIQVPKGSRLREVFQILLFKLVFVAWKWLHRVQKVGFSEEKCCQIYPRIKFLEQNFES
jgi:hypothetical protein